MTSQESLTTQSTNSETYLPETIRHGKMMARLKQWSGVLGQAMLEQSHRLQMRTRKAEDDYAIRQWGGSPEDTTGDEEMGTTILGDIQNPAPVIVTQPQSSLGTLAAIALGSMIPAAGLGGYLLANHLMDDKPTPVVQPETQSFDDESVNIGLGKIEDYLGTGK